MVGCVHVESMYVMRSLHLQHTIHNPFRVGALEVSETDAWWQGLTRRLRSNLGPQAASPIPHTRPTGRPVVLLLLPAALPNALLTHAAPKVAHIGQACVCSLHIYSQMHEGVLQTSFLGMPLAMRRRVFRDAARRLDNLKCPSVHPSVLLGLCACLQLGEYAHNALTQQAQSAFDKAVVCVGGQAFFFCIKAL